MKAGSVNLNLDAPKYGMLNKSPNRQVNFTGATSYKKEITACLHHAKAIERMENLKWLKGEMGGILLTAIGTGLVAPIFIGFNPFVRAPKNATPAEKEEIKNTKQYTAMRQPISATLAILFQASVLKYIDKGLDKVFNDPKYANFARVNLDQSKLNTDTRVKDNIRKEMKAQGRKKPSWVRTLFSKKAKEERAKYVVDFDKAVKARQESQINEIAALFRQTGEIKPGERAVKSEQVAELINAQIDEYIVDAKKLIKSPEKSSKEKGGIPYYLDRADILMGKDRQRIEDVFGRLKAKDSLTIEDIERAIAQNEDRPQVKLLLEEIKAKPDYLRMNRISRTLDRIKNIEAICGEGGYSREVYRLKLLDRNRVLNNIISQLSEVKISNPKAVDSEKIIETIRRIAGVCNFKKCSDNLLDSNLAESILKDTDTFADDEGKLTEKIFKDVSKRYKKLVENHYKSWNQITKIGVGVFITLPITCTALNWVYPRFMEIFFPKLSGVKKQQAQKNVQKQDDSQNQIAQQNKVGGDK